MKTTYYTLSIKSLGCTVKYAQSPVYEIKMFGETFPNSGEAEKQFKEVYGKKAEYLTEGAFQRKVETQAHRYQQELAKLHSWNAAGAQ